MASWSQTAELRPGLPLDVGRVEIDGVRDSVDLDPRKAAVGRLGINIGQRFAFECEGGIGAGNIGIADAAAVGAVEFPASRPESVKAECGVEIVVDARRNQRGR